MCVPRDGHPWGWEWLQREAAAPAAAFVAATAVDTLHAIFPTHVVRAATPADQHETAHSAPALAALGARLGQSIAGLADADERAELDAPAGAHWGPPAGACRVSRYYSRRCAPGALAVVEPCSGVVGGCAVLCVELFFDRSNAIVYRDVLSPLAAPLGDALREFSRAQGLPAGTAFSYMEQTAGGEWVLTVLSEHMLALPVGRVLMLPAVRASYGIDLFRLSPVGVQENSGGGVLVSVL